MRTRSIFVHVPKTGGVSVARALYGNLAGGHLTISDYRKVFRHEQFSKMFKFSIVRNPFDRLYSAYHFLRSGGMNTVDLEFSEKFLRRFESFEQFVFEAIENDVIMNYHHFRPQTEFIADGRDIQVLDFVGRYENLARDFERIKKRINPTAVLPHLNRNRSSADYRRSYTPAMVDQVNRLYKLDLDVLDYDFDGASER